MLPKRLKANPVWTLAEGGLNFAHMNLPLIRTVCFARRVLRDFFLKNNGMLLAGSVAYNAMLSLVPLAAVLVVGFSHFVDEELLMDAVRTEVGLISPKAAPMVTDVLETFIDAREIVGWVGLGVLLFFSSMAFRVLENAFAIIFHRKVPPVKRRFWVSALMPYMFIALIGAGLVVLTALTALAESSVGQRFAFGGVSIGLQWLATTALHVAGFLGLVLLFTTLYKVMPVTRISFRLALAGGVTAAVLWELLRTGLVSYFNHLSLVNAVYGSMATTIILLLTHGGCRLSSCSLARKSSRSFNELSGWVCHGGKSLRKTNREDFRGRR